MPPTDLLCAHNATFKRGDQTIISDLSFTLKKGDLMALVGPNGSGKSTLLEAIIHSQPAHSGQLSLAPGTRTAYLPQLCRMRRDFPLTVKDVVGSGLWGEIGVARPLHASHKQAIDDAIATVDLKSYAHTPIERLSGGQFQRVLFARLMVQKGDLLLLDEPFTGIDAHTTRTLLDIIKKWHQEGQTIVAVMHNLETVRQTFPQTLLLARSFSLWGKTGTVLTSDNLSMAYTKAHEWSACPC